MAKKEKRALIKIEKNTATIVNKLPSDIHDVLYRGMGYSQLISYMGTDKRGYRRRMLKNVIKSKYNYIKRTFPAGMVDRCVDLLQHRNFNIKILDKRPRFKVVNNQIVSRMASFPIRLRPYQIDAMAIGIQNQYMTFSVATGGGKTAILQAIAHATDLRTLVIVNRNDLLSQHVTVLRRNMEHDIGIIQGNKMDFDHQICVGTVQTIMAKLKSNRYKMNKYLKSIEYVVSDECQHAQSKIWKRAIRLCTNAMYRHGFSGSPWDHATSNMELEAICGKIKCKITASDLIKLGYLARPVITFHRYRGNGTPIDGPNLQIMYENTIVTNKTRNKAILDVVEKEYNKGDKLLLVVHRIKHGEILAQGLRKRGIHDREIAYLHGSKGRVTRVHGKKEFERGEIRIMIVSQIWNEGIDIPSCDVLVKADSFGGGEVRDSEGVRNLVQQIGRILRKPVRKGAYDVDTTKEHRVRVHDFADKHNKHVEKWTRNRMRTCLYEPEWIVKVDDI